ncbi:hypothetical protein [Enterocloster clostridioformis]|uniref:hypothetical protein n=1 Tax=Enterocloster clostridioformis TaxID=1531 RepID=UPI00156D50A1|nr:hypothetical protein [Enterocloster clostridioformis]NSJ55747.1 hypothetical protein [Enterocloster clostridioformis]
MDKQDDRESFVLKESGFGAEKLFRGRIFWQGCVSSACGHPYKCRCADPPVSWGRMDIDTYDNFLLIKMKNLSRYKEKGVGGGYNQGSV